ncbi:MAG: metallophosphoesterase [Anaerolineae bacterium]|nr:metallophosphoesterase [Anaerolineae bacterium]
MSQMENAAHLRRRYHDVELLLSCGDMPASYLEYITSVLNIPLFYVRGNHDTGYDERPPGGINLHRKRVEYHGVSFYGIEGSLKYNNSPIQYSQWEMRTMVYHSVLPLMYYRARKGRGVDVFVTHAPARGIHDLTDLPHRGIDAFLQFMDWYRPRYMLHGHVHTYDRRVTVETDYGETCVMNINPVTLLEIAPE